MKTLQSAMCAIVALSLCGSQLVAADAESTLFKEAETAFRRGDIETAKPKFQSLNQLNPKDKKVVEYLKLIAAKEAQMGGSASQEKQLAKLMMPKIELKEASLTEALEFLKQSVSKLSDGKQSVNFVIKLPEAQAGTPVTLNLTNIPFTEVLKYIGDLAHVTFTYERYAISVSPAASAAAPAAE